MKAKRLPRLWCALQGLLPLEACLAAQRGELAWPTAASRSEAPPQSKRNRAARAKPRRAA
jgi:hypothetical protein